MPEEYYKIWCKFVAEASSQMKSRLFRCLLFLILVSAGAGCAKQSMPSGGPRDVEPPVVLKSEPAAGSTMFSKDKVEITFDEYFTLDRVNEKFLVSPPMGLKPKISTKNKTLLIEFKEKLKDSTTYALNFQDIIRDLNEGNPIPNFQFAFSTGKVLDSLSVTGNVVGAFNLEALKNVLVVLYSSREDSAPRKMLPDYVTLADPNGYFRINNVKAGIYKLYALADSNSNNRYDPKDESFAFLDSLVTVNSERNYIPPEPVVKDTLPKVKPKKLTRSGSEEDTTGTAKRQKAYPFFYGEHKLYMFPGEKKNRYLASTDRKFPYQLRYCFSLPTDTFKVNFSIIDSLPSNYLVEKNQRGDTMLIWLRDSSLYRRNTIKTLISYPYTDSTGKVITRTDSISMRFTFPRQTKKSTPPALKSYFNIASGGIRPGEKMFFSSPTPLDKPDTSKIAFYELEESDKGKETGRKRFPYSLTLDSVSGRKVTFTANLKEGSKYLLITNKGSFRDIYGFLSDSSGCKMSVRLPNSFGHLTMDIRNGSGQMIVQLLDSKERIITQKFINKSGLADFPLLERGKYRCRVIYDTNGDGKWTSGSYENKRQPEAVSYFHQEIEVKTDWEIIEEWDVSQQHQKEEMLRDKKIMTR